jgi:hypothetical protein
MSGKFDLEQDILNCWSLLTDLDDVNRMIQLGRVSIDDVSTILSGLSLLYEIKFNKAIGTFNSCWQDSPRVDNSAPHDTSKGKRK